jgi:hypothetical protein
MVTRRLLLALGALAIWTALTEGPIETRGFGT